MYGYVYCFLRSTSEVVIRVGTLAVAVEPWVLSCWWLRECLMYIGMHELKQGSCVAEVVSILVMAVSVCFPVAPFHVSTHLRPIAQPHCV